LFLFLYILDPQDYCSYFSLYSGSSRLLFLFLSIFWILKIIVPIPLYSGSSRLLFLFLYILDPQDYCSYSSIFWILKIIVPITLYILDPQDYCSFSSPYYLSTRLLFLFLCKSGSSRLLFLFLYIVLWFIKIIVPILFLYTVHYTVLLILEFIVHIPLYSGSSIFPNKIS
jgi:hypothetical protein